MYLLFQWFKVNDNELVGLNGRPAAGALKLGLFALSELGLHVVEAQGAHAEVVARDGHHVRGIG